MSEISIAAEKIFSIGGWPFTNSVILGIFVVVLLLSVAFLLRKQLAVIPGKLQSIFEFFIESFLKLMESVFGNRLLAEKYLPLIATIFLFVMLSNWSGLLPGVGPIGLKHEVEGHQTLIPLFRAPSADLNFTIALALVSVLAVNIFSIKEIGIKSYLRKFFNFKKPIMLFVGLLEFISEFVKIISFSFRLFGNIFAGEVLLMIVAFLMPFVVPLPFLFLEVFVGFIQALIFSMLTMVFLSMAVRDEH